MLEVRDETEVQASATNGNRWRGEGLCDETPGAFRPETCKHTAKRNSDWYHSIIHIFNSNQMNDAWSSIIMQSQKS